MNLNKYLSAKILTMGANAAVLYSALPVHAVVVGSLCSPSLLPTSVEITRLWRLESVTCCQESRA